MKYYKWLGYFFMACFYINGVAFAVCETEMKAAATEAASAVPEYTYEYYLAAYQKNHEKVIATCSRSRSNCLPAVNKLVLCLTTSATGEHVASSKENQQPIQKKSSLEQQQESEQEAQLNAHQAQQQAQQRQARADQDRKGKRKRNEPENLVTECLSVDPDHSLFGEIVNKCDFKVHYVFCNLNTKEGSWAAAHDCVKHYGAAGDVPAKGATAANVKDAEVGYLFGCKDPAWPVDDEYLPGQGIAAYCHTMGGD